MFRHIPALDERPVPRYTSYPTAAEFTASVGAADQRLALEQVRPGTPVSLYVHIPFCTAICWYCACNTHALGSGERERVYLDALLTEIETVGRLMRGQVCSLHFGGGTPNSLPPDDLMRIIEAVHRHFRVGPAFEIAAELDPRALTPATITHLPRMGISRVSLGVQTFAPAVQAKIGRIQPSAMVAMGVGMLRQAGIAKINFDLMYGLPGQGLDDIDETLDLTLALEPDRLAVFGYAHVPQMMPRQKLIDAAELPDARLRFAQSHLAHLRLTSAGYQAIGFDHFALAHDPLAKAARTGGLRRNFQGFTDDPAETVVALGASAISQFDGLLVQNEKRPGHYGERALRGDLTGVRGAVRTPEDRLRGAIIERLLCDGAADLDALAERHGQARGLTLADPETLQAMERDGLIVRTGRRIAIPHDVLPYARHIASAFDAHRTPVAAMPRPAG